MTFTEEQARNVAARLRARTVDRLEARRRAIRSQLPEAARLLHEDFGAVRVFLIGSLEMPWFSIHSDVDLAVEGVPAERAGRAEEQLVELFGARVDLLLMEELDEAFRETIEREGRLLP